MATNLLIISQLSLSLQINKANSLDLCFMKKIVTNSLLLAKCVLNVSAQCALAIVVCGNMEKTMQGKGQEFWIQDCSAATENILPTARLTLPFPIEIQCFLDVVF